MKLVIATRNANKLREIRSVLGLNESQVKSSFDFPQIPDVVEDKDTLEGNAIKKAMTIASATGCWAAALREPSPHRRHGMLGAGR